MVRHSLLFLDDSSGRSADLLAILHKKSIPVTTAASEADLRRLLDAQQGRVLLVPSLRSCQGLLAELREAAVVVSVIVASPDPSVDEAVAALESGVVDYLPLPVGEERLDGALRKAGLVMGGGGEASGESRGCAAIIGASRTMQGLFALIKKICDTDTTVLVRGESGTGKELIAQAIHHEGVRGAGPFVPVNCGAIPGELLESELFGHEKGAFTHAIRTRIGRFELANGGTVFLDEISEMSPMLQVKLLRVLQEREFERIGGTKTIRSDFRVVAATNRDLEEEVRLGRFREDLYYRLNVIPVEAPPLRDRTQDIPLLVAHFMARFNRSRKKKIKGVADEVMARLLRYPWPGNVRELENMVERMVILAGGDTLTMEDLPQRLLEGGVLPADTGQVETIPEQGFHLNDVVAEFEKRLIVQALEQTDGVRNRAAKLLNVNRTTLIEKMKRFNLMTAS